MSKRGIFLPLLEQVLIRWRVVAETAGLTEYALRILIRAALGLVLLVHVLAVAASRLSRRLGADCRHSRRRSSLPRTTRATGGRWRFSPPAAFRSVTRKSVLEELSGRTVTTTFISILTSASSASLPRSTTLAAIAAALSNSWNGNLVTSRFGFAMSLIRPVFIVALVSFLLRLSPIFGRQGRATPTKGLKQVVLDVGLVGAPGCLAGFHRDIYSELLNQISR